jgi:tRNA-binding protein
MISDPRSSQDNAHSTEPPLTMEEWKRVDIRLGRILRAEVANTRSPKYRLTIDLGPKIGVKVSCGAYTMSYPDPSLLVGKLVFCVVNFKPMKMGPEMSEVLTLGFGPDQEPPTEAPVLIVPDSGYDAPLGGRVF